MSLSVKRSSSEASPPVQGLHPSSKRLKVSRMDNKENEIIIQAPAPYPTRSERDPRCLIPCVHGIIGDTRQTESICTESHWDYADASSDLPDENLDELERLLAADVALQGTAASALNDYYRNDGIQKNDLFILVGYMHIINKRVNAIRKAIAALDTRSNDCGVPRDIQPNNQIANLDFTIHSRAETKNISPSDRFESTRCPLNNVSSPNPRIMNENLQSHENGCQDDTHTVTLDSGIDSERAAVGDSLAIGTPQKDQSETACYPEIMHVLKTTFHLDNFRLNQLEAINATLDGKDVFVLMPTGGGKSLCYQVPAVCRSGRTDGTTFVISPLIALMIDQVHHLKEVGVDAVLFNSDQASESVRETRNRLMSSSSKPRLVYVTPEKLHHSTDMRNILRKLYQQRSLARFVIDEAHCISTWGRDFRDAYQGLGWLREDFPDIPIMALTATANVQVMTDVIDRLGIRGCVLLTQSFNRPNLLYQVRPKKRTVLADICAFIKNNHPRDTGIIYCLSRNKCEEVAKELRDIYKLRARHYHAQVSPEDKIRVQKAWQNGECEIIVATIAFGMGIDKADVRYVIHHSLPMSLDGYYQETGRAGRDGKAATCLLYYSYSDTKVLHKLINEGEKTSLEEKKRQEDGVRSVVRYCSNSVDCRRVQLLQYFGQNFSPSRCKKSCDNCIDSTEVSEEDVTEHAKNIAMLVQSAVDGGSGRVTKNHCMNVFRGCNLKDIRDRHHDMLPLFRAGQHMPREKVERLFDLLLVDGILSEQALRNTQGWTSMYIQPGPKYDELLGGNLKIVMKFKSGKLLPSESRSGSTKQRGQKRKPVSKDSVAIDKSKLDDRDTTDFCEVDVDQCSVYKSAALLSNGINQLISLREKLAQKFFVDEEDIMHYPVLEALGVILPTDSVSFLTVLQGHYDEHEAKKKWQAFGAGFLDVCIGLRYR